MIRPKSTSPRRSPGSRCGPRLVLRRNLGIGPPVRPWLAPEQALSQDLRRRLDEACGGDLEPIDFANPAVRGAVALADHVTLEIEVDDQLATQEPFASRGRRVTQAEFPALVGVVREQALAEFGPGVDRPD